MRENRTVLADLSTTRPGLETVHSYIRLLVRSTYARTKDMHHVDPPTAHLFPSGSISVRSYRPLCVPRDFLFQRIHRRRFTEKRLDGVHARPKPCPESGQDEDNATQEDSQDDHDKVHRSVSLDNVEGTPRTGSYM